MLVSCPVCQTPMVANRFEREYRCPNDDCRIVIPKYAIKEEIEPVEYDPALIGI